MNQHGTEIAEGRRFEFGSNWGRFLSHLNDERIEEAVRSLKNMLGVDDLAGKRFLDAGSGSGLFSLAARRLGARVHSFDFDPQSVACTRELRERYYPDDQEWTVEEASVLDGLYINGLGTFDVVYSWGVLHHTGAMWVALGNVAPLVANGGQLFVSIYNDQGFWSRSWLRIKQVYNAVPRPLRAPYALLIMGARELRLVAYSLITLTPQNYFQSWTQYQGARGMSRWHDLIDWVGGFPFEVAKPEEIFDFYRSRGFRLEHLKTCGGGLGCNEFVFRKG